MARLQNGKWAIRPLSGAPVVQIAIGGDVCPGPQASKLTCDNGAAGVFAALAPYLPAEALNIVQWETPLAVREAPIRKSGPHLNSPPEAVEIIRSANFHVALLANNHTGDHGPNALLETIRILQQKGLTTVGAGPDPETAAQPLEIRRNGKSICIFNFCEHEFGTASPGKPGTSALCLLENLAAVRMAATRTDFVLVTLHGGNEYAPFPAPRMVHLLRAFADAGASLVFNCHTHCPEGIEIYHGVPLVYAPGNLFFPGLSITPAWRTGYLPVFQLDNKGVYELEIIPYTFDECRIALLEGSRREAFFAYFEKLCRPLAEPETLQRLYEAWCLKYGRDYLSAILNALPERWEKDFAQSATADPMMPLRNLFHCESHRDLIAGFLTLVEEGRTAAASSSWPEIAAMQKMPWEK